MALKDIWKDLIDGESDVVADDINNIAHSVIDIEKNGLGEKIIVDSEMSDTSENPVQNKVAKKYVDDLSDTYATKEELADSKKWKTLLDVTLTEEQAGVNEIMLAIEDVESFINARQIRIAMSFPVAEAKAANAFWTDMRIRDINNKSYNQTFLAGYNVAGSANATYYTTCAIDMFDYAYSTTYDKGFHSLIQLPNPYFTVSANSVGNAREATGGFNSNAVKKYPPYLNINVGTVTLEAGTHIFMEVCD